MRITFVVACLVLVALSAAATAGQQVTATKHASETHRATPADTTNTQAEAVAQTTIDNNTSLDQTTARPQQTPANASSATDRNTNQTSQKVANPPQ